MTFNRCCFAVSRNDCSSAIQLSSLHMGHKEETVIHEGSCIREGSIDTVCTQCGMTVNSTSTGYGEHAETRVKRVLGTCIKQGEIITYCPVCGIETDKKEIGFFTHTGYMDDGICDVCKCEVPERDIYYGQCGDNAYWSYDPETATVTVSGEGDMWDGFEYPQGASFIGENRCNVQTVIIEDGITKISCGAFSQCSRLTRADISGSVKIIEKEAFMYALNLKELNLGEGLEIIGTNAFYSNVSLEEITLPSTVKEIGAYAFYRNTSLKKINFNEGLEIIGPVAFEENVSLEEITLPSTVKIIGSSAFSLCVSLKAAELNEGLKTVGGYAFAYDYLLKEVTIPSTVTSSVSYYETFNETPLERVVNKSPNLVFFNQEDFEKYGGHEADKEKSDIYCLFTDLWGINRNKKQKSIEIEHRMLQNCSCYTAIQQEAFLCSV